MVPRVVDDGGDSVPGERFHWVQEVSDVSRRVGGVKPRPHSLVAIENGWHAMVDLGERGTRLDCYDGVGVQWSLALEVREEHHRGTDRQGIIGMDIYMDTVISLIHRCT